MNMTPVPEAAKAWIALAGVVATALLGVFTADSDLGKVLTVVAVIATAVVTFVVPNRPAGTTPANEGGYTATELVLLLLAAVGVVLIILAVTDNLH